MRSFGVRTLTVTSPVQTITEPVTLTEAKLQLRIDHSSEDDLISMLISAARHYAEAAHGRDLVAAQWDLSLDYWRDEIYLADGLASVDLVTYTDEDGTVTAMTENTDYIVDLKRGLVLPPVGGSWPSATLYPSSAITIRYTVSPDVPEPVKVGILRLLTHYFVNRAPFDNATGTPAEWPVDVTRLLRIGARTKFA